MDDVTCDGTEDSLLDCGYKKKDNCGRGEGAGVVCQSRLRLLRIILIILLKKQRKKTIIMKMIMNMSMNMITAIMVQLN